MIDVEQAALGRLEQDALAGLQRLVQQARRVGDVRPHLLGVAEVLVAQRVGVERAGVRRQAAQQAVLARHDGAQPLAQVLGIQQFADADAGDAADLVLVARADAAAGGADGLFRRPASLRRSSSTW